jgi:hypothetical protein
LFIEQAKLNGRSRNSELNQLMCICIRQRMVNFLVDSSGLIVVNSNCTVLPGVYGVLEIWLLEVGMTSDLTVSTAQ